MTYDCPAEKICKDGKCVEGNISHQYIRLNDLITRNWYLIINFLIIENKAMSDIAGSCSGTYDIFKNLNNLIQSPNFPENYDDEQDCNWKITAPNGSHLRLRFANFDTKKNVDTLKIYDGEDDKWPLLHSISGCHDNEVVTTGNNMYLLFTSDGRRTEKTYRGFRGVITYSSGRL